jgi:hypothetical protein
MKKQDLFIALHASLAQIKSLLESQGIAERYKKNMTEIESVMNQYPRLSTPHKNRMFAKTEDITMLQNIEAGIEHFVMKMKQDLTTETKTLEAEFNGTRNYSEYAMNRAEHYADKIDLERELEKLLTLVKGENQSAKKTELQKPR